MQAVGITTTKYTLDTSTSLSAGLAAGLTQVLDDGAFTYLYGNGRVAQYDATGAQYFLGDTLGSVRQMVDSSGEMLLAQSYEPYGDILSKQGEGSSIFQFTGEVRDVTGLTYLRARYLDSRTGRFIQVDPSKIERNLYLYTNANPVNHTDPTGLFSPEQIASSMGYPSFDVMAMSLATIPSAPFLESSRFEKWGFFSALLDANDGDSLRTGSLTLMTTYPHVQYLAPQKLWIVGCDQIMVGNHTLESYFDYVLVQPTYRELPAEFWRDTSPSYYHLSGPNTVSRIYFEGSSFTDLPDFHSIFSFR